MRNRWSNVPGLVCAEGITVRNGVLVTQRHGRWQVLPNNVWEDGDGKELPESVSAALNEAYPEADESLFLTLNIHFVSNGYYDSGRTNCRNDDCYPPEGEDERELSSVEVNNGFGHDLDGEAAQDCFDHFYKQVEAVELDTDRGGDEDFEVPEPDYDAVYEPIMD